MKVVDPFPRKIYIDTKIHVQIKEIHRPVRSIEAVL